MEWQKRNIHSEMLKTKHSKTGKRQNRNFQAFRFWHVLISEVWALWNMLNLSENQTRSVWAYACPKTKHSIPFSLMDVPFLDRFICPKMERFCLVFRCCPNSEPTENGTEVEHLRTECVRILYVDCRDQLQLS